MTGIHYVFRPVLSDEVSPLTGRPYDPKYVLREAAFFAGDVIPFHVMSFFRGECGTRADYFEGISEVNSRPHRWDGDPNIATHESSIRARVLGMAI
jgi:hypothetical protein